MNLHSQPFAWSPFWRHQVSIATGAADIVLTAAKKAVGGGSVWPPCAKKETSHGKGNYSGGAFATTP